MARMTVKSLASATRRLTCDDLQRLQPSRPTVGRTARADPGDGEPSSAIPGPTPPAGRCGSVRAEAVGVLLSERLSYAFSDPFAIEFLTGLSEVVEEHGISIVLMPLSSRAVSKDSRLSSTGTDGSDVRPPSATPTSTRLPCCPLPTDHPAAMVARARGIRLVTTDINSDPDSSWVAIDDFGAGVMVGEHLATLGHRDVAVLVETNQPAGSPGRRLDEADLGFLDYAARVAGLRQAIKGDVMIVSGGHNSIESGVTATSWLLSRDQIPTAIVGLSDVLALGALEVLAAGGLSVPGVVSVCGFDDIAAAQATELTTVHQPIRDKGRHVGRLLIDPEGEPRQVLLPISLMRRATTGPAREPYDEPSSSSSQERRRSARRHASALTT